MGVRAILQHGRTKAGLILPADMQAKLQQMQDKSTHEKWAPKLMGSPRLVKKPPTTKDFKLPVTPPTAPPPDRLETMDTQVSPQLAPPATEDTRVDSILDDLTLIEGVGDSLQEKLHEAKYMTYEDVMNASPDKLSEIHGISEDSAKGLIKQSKALAKKKAKGKL